MHQVECKILHRSDVVSFEWIFWQLPTLFFLAKFHKNTRNLFVYLPTKELDIHVLSWSASLWTPPAHIFKHLQTDELFRTVGSKRLQQFPHNSSWQFQPIWKYQSNWIISPGRDENKTCLKPPPRISWEKRKASTSYILKWYHFWR